MAEKGPKWPKLAWMSEKWHPKPSPLDFCFSCGHFEWSYDQFTSILSLEPNWPKNGRKRLQMAKLRLKVWKMTSETISIAKCKISENQSQIRGYVFFSYCPNQFFAALGHFWLNYQNLYLTWLFQCKKSWKKLEKKWVITPNDKFDPQCALKCTHNWRWPHKWARVATFAWKASQWT